MAEYQNAVVLAALMFLYRPSISGDKLGCECNTVASLVVLTAALACVTATDLTLPFSCKLPNYLQFLYEFLLSLFVFEVAVRVFWDRAECFVVGALPSAVDRALGGRCLLFGLLCPSSSALFAGLFVGLAYLVAVALLCTVLFGYGVLSAPNPLSTARLSFAMPLACRRCLNALKGQC